jgi:hypothetical protein
VNYPVDNAAHCMAPASGTGTDTRSNHLGSAALSKRDSATGNATRREKAVVSVRSAEA